MPPLPAESGLYAWKCDDAVVYVGQTRTPLVKRLGPNGYATISTYNTLAREPGRRNGGQQTNCRINALASDAMKAGATLSIWYRVTPPDRAAVEESLWMAKYGKPPWNRRLEQPLMRPLEHPNPTPDVLRPGLEDQAGRQP